MTTSHMNNDEQLEEAASGYGALLNELDRLKGKNIDLPQLVVVGDQSSGKSSVLEALSAIPVPIAESLSTRFPIEIVLRRSNTQHRRMSIQGHNFSEEGFEFEKIPILIGEAAKALGIVPDKMTSNAKHFSAETLRIEISGPEQSDLTFIDLPGIFTAGTASQNEQGKQLVREMVESHIANDKNIVLLVASMRKPLNDQNALEIVRKSAEAADRTVGVVTHPDDSRVRDEPFKLVNNEEFYLKQGWCCLRNLSSFERGDARNRREVENDYFNTGRWREVSPEKKGIRSLHMKLETVMYRHISLQLPAVIKELREQKRKNERKLNSLPADLGTEHDQRKYLSSIARAFESLLLNAVNGTYSATTECVGFFGIMDHDQNRNQNRRLRANIRELTKAFIDTMSACGREHNIVEDPLRDTSPSERRSSISEDSEAPPETEGPDETKSTESDDRDRLSFEHSEFHGFREHLFLNERFFRYYDSYPVSQDITRKEFERLAIQKLLRFRGKEAESEFGESSMSVLFIQESRKWKDIAFSHLEAIKEAVREVIGDALTFCVPKQLSEALGLYVLKPNMERLRDSLERKLEILLKCHHSGNTGFLDTFRSFSNTAEEDEVDAGAAATSAARIPEAVLQTIAKQLGGSLAQSLGESVLKEIEKAHPTGLNSFLLSRLSIFSTLDTEHGVSESLPMCRASDAERLAVTRMVSQFEAYYKMNLHAFVGYVNAMVVEDALLKNLPKAVFCEQIISELREEEIKEIVKISDNVAAKRKKYQDIAKELGSSIQNLSNFLIK